MNDYLEIFEKFKDTKEIFELCDEVVKLRLFYQTGQYQLMQDHIAKIKNKYLVESTMWNLTNTQPPQTYEQAYINAENFLQSQGAKLIIEKITNYKSLLSPDEITYIETIKQI